MGNLRLNGLWLQRIETPSSWLRTPSRSKWCCSTMDILVESLPLETCTCFLSSVDHHTKWLVLESFTSTCVASFFFKSVCRRCNDCDLVNIINLKYILEQFVYVAQYLHVFFRRSEDPIYPSTCSCYCTIGGTSRMRTCKGLTFAWSHFCRCHLNMTINCDLKHLCLPCRGPLWISESSQWHDSTLLNRVSNKQS